MAVTETETEERVIRYNEAFTETLQELMREDPDIFIAGEDVGRYGGVFQSFAGLNAEFGDERVVDTPIAEQAIIGLGIGAAAMGLRPIVDLMFMDFVMVAMDQIANQAAKMKYMYGGKASLPLTITTTAGAGLGAAAQHSQSLEAWLIHVPGLKVVYPSNAYDLKGLLVSCVRDDNPTIITLHKKMLGSKAHVPEGLYEIPLGVANIVRPGTDVTVVAIGKMVDEAKKAADILSEEGIDIEIIDPRSLLPFDTETVVQSAKKTNRIVIVHEAVRNGGIGAEIAAQIQEEAFDYLDAPIARVGAPFSPVPFSPALEMSYVPSAESIIEGVRGVLHRIA
ncbi:MAG: alpha-ketoacid dehydrogenase subunit beta [Acidimicrobiales bacterium]|jgi:acetoin:2,6-dichlorophenolindophenol oxidoreductase subunit beta|nr:alpha-ketoacid dehydrogenase subunit beta [Acidimicrobiales bacterium]MDG1845890.1 alpha-ketoacid dehydrogenase subunit beta [Acidimicrobiales bacterium]